MNAGYRECRNSDESLDRGSLALDSSAFRVVGWMPDDLSGHRFAADPGFDRGAGDGPALFNLGQAERFAAEVGGDDCLAMNPTTDPSAVSSAPVARHALVRR